MAPPETRVAPLATRGIRLAGKLQRDYKLGMKHLTLPIVVEADSDGYFVSFPARQGCYSHSDTYEEAVENIRDAIRLHIQDRLANGEEIHVHVSLSTVEVAV